MNTNKKLLNLKLFKLFLLKKREKEIITTRELGDYILKNRVIPTPIYSKKNERRFIVEARTIWTNPKAKKIKKIKF